MAIRIDRPAPHRCRRQCFVPFAVRSTGPFGCACPECFPCDCRCCCCLDNDVAAAETKSGAAAVAEGSYGGGGGGASAAAGDSPNSEETVGAPAAAPVRPAASRPPHSRTLGWVFAVKKKGQQTSCDSPGIFPHIPAAAVCADGSDRPHYSNVAVGVRQEKRPVVFSYCYCCCCSYRYCCCTPFYGGPFPSPEFSCIVEPT